jgi:hypothetical protein
MASDRPEQLITVPSELVVSGKGLALDIGKQSKCFSVSAFQLISQTPAGWRSN